MIMKKWFIIWILFISPWAQAKDSLIPVVYYTPETSVAGGAIYLQNFGEVEEGRSSGIRYIAIYTAKSQSVFILRPNFWWQQGKFNLAASLVFENFPSRYFGPGNQTQKKDFEAFSERGETQKLMGAWRWRSNSYLHLTYSRLVKDLYKVEKGGRLEQDLNDGKLESFYILQSYGLGVSWDDRDLLRYPSQGGFYKLSYFIKSDGDQSNFNEWDLDLRKYWSLNFTTPWVMAVQFGAGVIDGSSDEVPFQSLLKLGGKKILRGYYEGRFRDLARTYLQLEARRKWNRWGMGVFSSVGMVAENLEGLQEAQAHWSFGAGGHYFLGEDGTAIRLDLGMADGSTSFYFVLDQAF